MSLRRWALAAIFGMVGCQVIGDIADVEFAEPVTFIPGVGGAGGGGGGAGGEGGICESVPTRPSESGGADEVDVVLAMRSIDFGEQSYRQLRLPTIGLDLDDATTECDDGVPLEDTVQRCTPPASVEEEVLCDGECGVDNAAARVFSAALGILLSGAFSGQNASAVLSDDLCKGRWTMLFRVYDYDGTANDDQVSLAVYPAQPLETEVCPPAGGAGGGGGSDLECVDGVARWDGEDAWPVLTAGFDDPAAGPTAFCPHDESTVRGLQPNYVDPNAYVADGRLVAALASARFVLYAREVVLPFDLTSSTVMGDLVQVDGQWRLDNALVAGRWPVRDIFDGLSLAKLNGEPICKSDTNVFYGGVKDAICANRDLPTQLGPVVPCDALSYAFAFTASEARLGNVVESTELVPGCTPETDPATDACE